MENEALLLWSALTLYVGAGSAAILGTLLKRPQERLVLSFLLAAAVLHALSLGLRWQRLGHGPFVTLHEILSSNIWSLHLLFALVYWRFRVIRPSAAVVLPVLFVMMAWLLLTDSRDSRLPPTFDTIWLYLHVGFGKVFLGAALVATGLGSVILVRRFRRGAFPALPDDQSLDELSYRFLSVGLVFDTLMLIAGAIWAQFAWGRYWNWDPLETWSLINWLWVVLALHIRPTFHIPPAVGAVLSILVFVIGFITFFGVPFLSQAPHQGVV